LLDSSRLFRHGEGGQGQGHSNNTAGIVWGFVGVVPKNSFVLISGDSFLSSIVVSFLTFFPSPCSFRGDFPIRGASPSATADCDNNNNMVLDSSVPSHRDFHIWHNAVVQCRRTASAGRFSFGKVNRSMRRRPADWLLYRGGDNGEEEESTAAFRCPCL
jgi:hypothetical protein